MTDTNPRTRIRIIIDDQDRPTDPTAPYQLNVYTDDLDGTQNRYPTNPGGRATIGDNIPDMLTALAAAWREDPIEEEDGEEP